MSHQIASLEGAPVRFLAGGRNSPHPDGGYWVSRIDGKLHFNRPLKKGKLSLMDELGLTLPTSETLSGVPAEEDAPEAD